jgi:hypothetical protein
MLTAGGVAVETYQVYRVGVDGLLVVGNDGRERRHPPGSLVWFERLPRRVVGTLHPQNRERQALPPGSYETKGS